MKSKGIVRQEKTILFEQSDDESAFSAESTDQESSDAKVRRKKRQRSSSESDDEVDKNVRRKKKLSKQKSKYNRNTDSESDPDDPPLQLDEDLNIKSEPKTKPTTLFKKKEIIPFTDDEIKEKFKYKRHKCALDYLPTKNNRPIGKCRKGRPAELKVDEVKLHYVVHYKEHGIWDHIVPEEGDNEGKIDSYECKVCFKKFKNSLEKKIYQGRGSSICHVATEHGRLLKALIEEGGLSDEIELLAKYDKSFNDAYNEYFDNKDALFGATDEEIISIKPSLVWKIYAKGDKNSDNPQTDNSDQQQSSTSIKTDTLEKENCNANERVQSQPSNTQAKPNAQTLQCPFKKEMKCEFKPTNNLHAFRMHFFQHYPVEQYWEERLNDMEQGDKCMYCDLCSQRKRVKGDTANGIKKSMVCHLAIQHCELRPIMEKDTRLSKEFIKTVYYDIDNEQPKDSDSNKLVNIKVENASSSNKSLKNDENETTVKHKPGPKSKTTKPGPKSKTQQRPGPKSKTKPGPKSKTMASKPKKLGEKLDEDEEGDSDSEENDCSISDLSSNLSSDQEAWVSGSKKSTHRKSPNRPDPDLPRKNENYVRKRRPLNLTLEDLEADEVEDENWRQGLSDVGKSDIKVTGSGGKKTRVMPRRRVAEKKATFSDESE